MITVLRMIRLWQLKVKWELALWQFLDKQASDLIKNPENLEKKIISEIAKNMHEKNT